MRGSDLKSGSSSNTHAVVSLFTGAGGLDIGLEAAGFLIDLCIEIDGDARQTLSANRPGWILATPGDIYDTDSEALALQVRNRRGRVAVLTAGPPCQPFSKSANWTGYGTRGIRDPRAKTLSAYLRFVEAMLPRILLLENVPGITLPHDDGALHYLRHALDRINHQHGTRYDLEVLPINAADYGVPQFRERVFLLATIDGGKLTLPPPTHGNTEELEPYRTSWDAIGHLDSAPWPSHLDLTGRWTGLLASIPEGQNYLWHTPRGAGEPLFGWRTRYWSFLLKLAKTRPSWTIQAEAGPATGPFHWKNRLLSIEEIARLQTLPSGYKIIGNRRSLRRQVGNAVPSAIGELLGLEIRRQLFGESVRRSLGLIPSPQIPCPAPEECEPVPEWYLQFRAPHRDHPGTGKGPAAQLLQHA